MKPRNAAKKRGVHQQQTNGAPSLTAARPDWKPYLDAYPDKKLLVFHDEKDLEAAIDLLWTDALRTMPHDSPDGRSLVVPAEALAYFTGRGLSFTTTALRSINDLSAEQIRSLRR